jgi:ABC-2 type transport system permease protein
MQTFLGGILAPLPLLPLPLRIMATILPFRWIFSFPTELVLGRLTVQTALAEFAVQIGWTLLSILLLHLLWRAGIKRYSAVGG